MNITCCPICDMQGEISPLSKGTNKLTCQSGHFFSSIEDVLSISKIRDTQLLQRYEHQLLQMLTKDQKVISEKGWEYIWTAGLLQTLGLLLEIQKLRREAEK